jgi:hypothetical protein
MIDGKKLTWDKISKLPTVNDMLDEKYGKEGTSAREAFNREVYIRSADAPFFCSSMISSRRRLLRSAASFF